MAKNVIVCGHGAGDPGAAANGINERDFIRQELAPRIKKYAGAEVEIYDMSKNRYKETQRGRGIYSLKGKNVIEFHLDAAGSTAKGGHVIFGSGLKADALDERLAGVIKKHFGWRGNKAFHPRSNLLNANTAKRIGVNYRLVEVCFVTNPHEVAYLKRNIDQIARDFAAAITAKPIEPAAPRTWLQEGDKGDDVKELQEKLNSIGINIGKADGDFGPRTKTGVILFQKRKGLTPDGLAGEDTMTVLNKLIEERKEEELKTEDIQVKPAEKKEEPKVGEYKKDALAPKSLLKGQEWAKENGISDGTYPDRPMTRAKGWEMLRRFEEHLKK